MSCSVHQGALQDTAEKYLKVQLELEDASVHLSEVDLRFFIISGLRSLHGEVGAALTFDLQDHHEESNTAILRLKQESLLVLWSSLSFLGFYKSLRCAFRVQQVSSDPPGL